MARAITPAHNIDSFVGYFKDGFAYSNLFACYIDFAKVHNGSAIRLADIADKSSPGIAVACQTASIPGKSLITKERFTQSVPKPMAYNVQYSDVTCTFLVEHNKQGRNTWAFFNNWMDIIVNPTTAFVSYVDDYSCDIYLSLMNAGNGLNATDSSIGGITSNPIRKVVGIKLENAFPKSIAEISVSQSDANVSTFGVTFAVHRWKDILNNWTERGAKANKEFKTNFNFEGNMLSDLAILKQQESEVRNRQQ